MRLIDADDLKKNIGICGLLIAYRDREGVKQIKDVIDNQPTAYDVEKVAEQLENGEFETTEEPHAINVYKAIEIVKGGSKDE